MIKEQKQQQKNLKTMPLTDGYIHHVGVGGIGMSGIAEILYNMGYKVSGSDLSTNANVLRLKKLGVKFSKGHKAQNVADASVVVKSTAVSYANPEIIEARRLGIPVVRRSEMLAELTKMKATIAVAGSHGKTTTTSIISHILYKAGLEPTIINGGVINSIGSNAMLGSGDWLVAEADESDGTFINIPATVGIITNIDPEHMDYWKDISKIYEAFNIFIKQLPFYGFAVLNIDHFKVREIAENVEDRKIYTYSMEDEKASVFIKDCLKKGGKSYFTAVINMGEHNITEKFTIPYLGNHNISNTAAAIAVCLGIGMKISQIKAALNDFAGVKRRFSVLGKIKGATFVDDYAHHPVEIKATLQSARDYIEGKSGRILAIMQPHRYTRLEDLFEEFSSSMDEADKIIITQMYSAGENEIEGVNQFTLAEAIKSRGKDAVALESDDKLENLISKEISENDIVIFMGAGTITNYASEVFKNLK